MNTKKEKLLTFFDSVLYHPEYKHQFKKLLLDLDLTEQNILDAFLHYNLELNAEEGNEVYRPLPNRVVLHIHNLIEESWHIERQQIVLDLLCLVKPKTIADIGFGVPSRYVKYVLNNCKKTKILFCDIYDSAFKFAKSLLPLWDEDWQSQISFKKTDMDTQEYIGDMELYLIQDAIEHTVDPTAYLKKHVKLSPKQSKFIISLPIGPIFPRHYKAWDRDDEAIQWLDQCGLVIEEKKSVFVKPDVDLFADQLSPDYHDLYALCFKKAT